ncbi:hypothetical protein QU481_16190 [Crenobacter sp. SG2303]|uniref:Uncharacterized protein n=1 Tax=Crenobacter oryzisoli TaxID=3056844 RepID=A0ABT7XRJ2_9NEIS|nr:hypothetical protein [Crenobacter sp. SG2303]MDN0076414.1 hypothetical protein [Crenobacter sp. SG2303]
MKKLGVQKVPLIGKGNKQFLGVEFGIGMEAAKWLADQGIVAFGSSTQVNINPVAIH